MINSLLQSIYGPLELDAVAGAIANDGRRWLSCDRLSVLELRQRRCRLLAVSGVDVVDRRADVCVVLEELAQYVAMSDEAVAYPDAEFPFASELQQTIDGYLQESHARQLLAVPLSIPASATGDVRGQTVGVLVLEQFTKQADLSQWRDRLSDVQPHFALALGHALARKHAPLARLSAPAAVAEGIPQEPGLLAGSRCRDNRVRGTRLPLAGQFSRVRAVSCSRRFVERSLPWTMESSIAS